MTHLDDMFTEAPLPPSRNRGALGKRLSGVVILGLVTVMVVIAWRLVAGDSAPTDYPGPGSGEVTVVVPRGATLTEIGQALQEAGVVLTGTEVKSLRAGGAVSWIPTAGGHRFDGPMLDALGTWLAALDRGETPTAPIWA